MTVPAAHLPPADPPARERAVADYLAVSRNAHLYASPADYARAEQRAWDRLAASVPDVAGVRPAA